jgi:hypothetical protein
LVGQMRRACAQNGNSAALRDRHIRTSTPGLRRFVGFAVADN